MKKTHSTILSFIVPVYNVAPYLRKCVDSLLTQDYDDYEIILVDDGSTDSCPSICDEYGQKYDVSMYDVCRKCVRVIHQKNAGLSAARNAGIAAAQGEYICFVDSDDYWEPNVLGGLMAQVEKDKLDVLRFKYQHVNEQYEKFNPYKSDPYRNDDYTDDVIDGVSFLNSRFGTACYAVMFVIRRAMLVTPYTLNITHHTLEKDICLFTPGIHFEDVDWLPRMMLKAQRVNSTSTVVYNYLIRQGSITQVQGDKAKIRKNLEDRLLIINKYRQYIEQYPECAWLRNMQSSMVVSVLANVAQYLYKERKEYIGRLKAISVFPLSLDSKLEKTYMRKARLINISPELAVHFIHLKNRK